jgi:uncharacterized protein (DUF4415 family)
MNVKRTSKPQSKSERPGRGRADLARLRKASEQSISRSSPPELADLPPDFWANATMVHPVAKRPISLRVDADVLSWFKKRGPRYQSRIYAVLRAYVKGVQGGLGRKERPNTALQRTDGKRSATEGNPRRHTPVSSLHRGCTHDR